MPDLYYYGDEANQFSFFRIPKALITSPQFKSVSTEAKLLYGLLLDRMELSTANGWLDDNNRVYIYYTIEEISKDLCCGRDKAMKMLAELESVANLIERARQGRGMPSRIYVKRFMAENNCKNKKSNKPTSRSRKPRLLEVEKSDPNNTDKNNTEKNYTDISIYPSRREQAAKQISRQINLPYLQAEYPYDDVDCIAELMTDAVCSTAKTQQIGAERRATVDIAKRFSMLDHSHIEYVLDSLSKTERPIKNIKAYLLAALYNAPLTIGQYSFAAARADIAGAC